MTRTTAMTALLTGFGPFPGVPVNATMHLVQQLAAEARSALPGLTIAEAVLPTEWDAGPALLTRLVAQHRPEVVISFGVSPHARGFEIETVARNHCAARPDASGRLPLSIQIASEGPSLLEARLPVRKIVRRLRARNIPAFASSDAGDYLCNRTLYDLIRLARHNAGIRHAGFVHLPNALEAAGPASPLTWAQALSGGIEILAACTGRRHPRRNLFEAMSD